MGIDEIKALLKLDGITWEESINTVDKMSPRKYRVRIQYAATNFFYPFVDRVTVCLLKNEPALS